MMMRFSEIKTGIPNLYSVIFSLDLEGLNLLPKIMDSSALLSPPPFELKVFGPMWEKFIHFGKFI